MKNRKNSLLTVGHGPEPLLLELQHLIREAHAFLADDVLAGHTDVVEEHLGRVRRPHPQFIDLASDVHSCARRKDGDKRLSEKTHKMDRMTEKSVEATVSCTDGQSKWACWALRG